ncbi:MAG: hypothetical protein CL484_04025 [Acidobacteria bacterium]|nr:hypothetical protein [Acidobacteriota bacterium]|tara:strand:+ start:270 stop:623 length:354 start_codon:yes stop_codon:yes gene_type:complete
MNRKIVIGGTGVMSGLVGLLLAYRIADPRMFDSLSVFMAIAFGVVPALGGGLLANGLLTGGGTVAVGAGILAGFGGLLVASLDVRSLPGDLVFVAVPAVVVRLAVGWFMRKKSRRRV